MNLLNKILNPLKQNKERNYQDLSKDSKQVKSNPPSELLVHARNIAGEQIQSEMLKLENCKWIRAEYTYPAFDSMNFIYNNHIFSVVIDIQDEDGESFLPPEFIKRQLYAAKTYNLIPCKFSVVVPDPENPEIDKAVSKTKGWNLFNTKTNEKIVPTEFPLLENAEMSDWELRNFGIRFILKYFQAKKIKTFSFQDTLEVDPQIWFQDNEGNKCWILLRVGVNVDKVEKPEKMNEIIRRCFQYNGYFAGISLEPKNKNETKLYRSGDVRIKFDGLEKIHSVM